MTVVCISQILLEKFHKWNLNILCESSNSITKSKYHDKLYLQNNIYIGRYAKKMVIGSDSLCCEIALIVCRQLRLPNLRKTKCVAGFKIHKARNIFFTE